MKIPETVRASPLSWGRGPGCTAIELSPAAGPHWQALNLNRNRNLARLRILEIKSKIMIKIRKKPFRLDSMAVGRGEGNENAAHPNARMSSLHDSGIAHRDHEQWGETPSSPDLQWIEIRSHPTRFTKREDSANAWRLRGVDC